MRNQSIRLNGVRQRGRFIDRKVPYPISNPISSMDFFSCHSSERNLEFIARSHRAFLPPDFDHFSRVIDNRPCFRFAQLSFSYSPSLSDREFFARADNNRADCPFKYARSCRSSRRRKLRVTERENDGARNDDVEKEKWTASERAKSSSFLSLSLSCFSLFFSLSCKSVPPCNCRRTNEICSRLYPAILASARNALAATADPPVARPFAPFVFRFGRPCDP